MNTSYLVKLFEVLTLRREVEDLHSLSWWRLLIVTGLYLWISAGANYYLNNSTMNHLNVWKLLLASSIFSGLVNYALLAWQGRQCYFSQLWLVLMAASIGTQVLFYAISLTLPAYPDLMKSVKILLLITASWLTVCYYASALSMSRKATLGYGVALYIVLVIIFSLGLMLMAYFFPSIAVYLEPYLRASAQIVRKFSL